MKITDTFRKPYILFFIAIFITYLALNVFLSKFYITAQYIPYFLDTLNWTSLFLSVFFTIAIGVLVSVNIILSYDQYQKIKKQKDKQNSTTTTTAVTAVGTIGGLATGVCTACVASIFPVLLGLFGVTLSFASLPFQGLEIQVFLILILGINLYYLQK